MILQKKVAIVTGASRGAGAGIARALGREGAAVCVNYFRSQEAAEDVAHSIRQHGGEAFAQYADVTQAIDAHSMVEAVLHRYGHIDIVVNNALPAYTFDPTAPYTHIETIRWEHFVQQHEGAVKAAFNMVQAVLPTMKARQFGKIINISTNLVSNPVVTYYDYTTAKAGLLGLTRNLAAELGQYGIRVNLVAGGLLRITDASALTSDEVFHLIAQSTPLRQVITVEAFADAVLFFAADWSNAVTGQSLAVDGGLTMS